MSLNNVSSMQNIVLAASKGEELSTATKIRLEALGIEPSTVKSEAQAQILIAQAEAAPKQNNSGYEKTGCSSRLELLRDAKELAESTGTAYSERDDLENILKKISSRLNFIKEVQPDKTDIVEEYEKKLLNIANKAQVSINLQENIFNKMNMISLSNRLILGL